MVMSKLVVHTVFVAVLSIVVFSNAAAQERSKYNYAAQKQYIPAELGQVYLGMPFKEFASKIDLKMAEADARYGPLQLEIPLTKGNVTMLMVRIHGLDPEESSSILRPDKVMKKGDEGLPDQETEIQRLDTAKIPAKGVVYSMYVTFKPGFDLKGFVNKTYGKGEVRADDDEYHFYDEQWLKTTSDGLGWMIRAFYKGDDRTLQLLGRVPGTEWDPEA